MTSGKDKRDNKYESNDTDNLIKLNPQSSVADQVPLSWHPQYGVYLSWPILWLTIAIIILGGLAFISQMNLLFWCASLAAAMLAISIILPGRNISHLEITRSVPDTGIVGKPMMIQYTIRNKRNYLPSYSLRIADIIKGDMILSPPKVYIPYLPAGRKYNFQVAVIPSHRGTLVFQGIRIASKYPFGLMMRFDTIPLDDEVTIYPALGRLTRHLFARSRDADFFAGDTHSRARGNSDEFYSLREYRQGDNPKLIHWRRSAGAGQLIVREMTQFSPMRLTVIFDAYVSKVQGYDEQDFEQLVSFAATLLCHSLESGYRTALVCIGDKSMVVPPISGRDGQHRILHLLSEVSPQFRKPLAQAVNSMQFSPAWRGRCIIVSMNEQPSSVLQRLAEDVGMVKLFVYNSAEWKKLFVPPEIISKERTKQNYGQT